MHSKLFFVFGLLLFAGMALARRDEFNNDYEFTENDETHAGSNKQAMNNYEKRMEDPNSKTSKALSAKNDEYEPDIIKHKGLCHWGINLWYKPKTAVRCHCVKCICQDGGNWVCDFHFPFCPYFYCGNVIYNPALQICCCGKVHEKKAEHSCCGYFYYDRRINQCCNYYSVKPKKSICPRDRV